MLPKEMPGRRRTTISPNVHRRGRQFFWEASHHIPHERVAAIPSTLVPLIVRIRAFTRLILPGRPGLTKIVSLRLWRSFVYKHAHFSADKKSIEVVLRATAQRFGRSLLAAAICRTRDTTSSPSGVSS